MLGCTPSLPSSPQEPLSARGRLHRQGERRQRPGAFVDLDAVKVVGQDQARDLGRVIAFLLVDRMQEVEGIGQHMPRSAGGSQTLISSGDAMRRKSSSGSSGAM